MRTMSDDQMKKIPRLPQTQAALEDQLVDLMDIANKLGFYDAADFLKSKLGR